MGLGTRLCDQAIRFMRVNWDGWTKVMGDELYLVLLQACGEDTGPVSFIPPAGPPILLPPSNAPPPFDPGPPVTVVVPTPTETPSGDTIERVSSEIRWHRESFPAQVQQQSPDVPYFYYDVIAFPRGFIEDTEGEEIRQVLQLQIDPGAVIPTGTWTIMNRLVKVDYRTSSVVRASDGVILSTRLDIIVLGQENFMQVPVWL